VFVIDRFEGEYALIEHKKRIFHVPKILMPKGAKVGDVIKISVTVDAEGTAKLKKDPR